MRPPGPNSFQPRCSSVRVATPAHAVRQLHHVIGRQPPKPDRIPIQQINLPVTQHDISQMQIIMPQFRRPEPMNQTNNFMHQLRPIGNVFALQLKLDDILIQRNRRLDSFKDHRVANLSLSRNPESCAIARGAGTSARCIACSRTNSRIAAAAAKQPL